MWTLWSHSCRQLWVRSIISSDYAKREGINISAFSLSVHDKLLYRIVSYHSTIAAGCQHDEPALICDWWPLCDSRTWSCMQLASLVTNNINDAPRSWSALISYSTYNKSVVFTRVTCSCRNLLLLKSFYALWKILRFFSSPLSVGLKHRTIF